MFGLPMRRDGGGFRDVVSGRMVYRWIDTKGRKWLAHHRWDLLGRVARARAELKQENSND